MRSYFFAACAGLSGLLVAATAARGADLASGLVGYWRLDESAIGASSAAVDSSATGANGLYVGAPAAAAEVPALMYSDASSVLFSKAMTQAVRVAAIPAALEPAAATLSAWFKVRMPLSSSYSDVVSVGDQLLLRVYPSQVGTAKRVPATTWVPLNAAATPGDGKWHHLAAAIDGAGLALYFDGARIAMLADAQAITYDLGPDLWIGRHGSGTGHDFDGHIDEVAIWARTLSGSEIAALASGAEPGSAPRGPPPDPAADAGRAPDAGGAGDAAPEAAAAPPDGTADVSAPTDAPVDQGSRFRPDGGRPPLPSASGCACATAPSQPRSAALLTLALALAVCLSRRRPPALTRAALS